jgi:hypothetical protein
MLGWRILAKRKAAASRKALTPAEHLIGESACYSFWQKIPLEQLTLTIVALGLAVGCVFGFLGALDRSEYATGQCAIKQGRIGPAPPGAVKRP